MTVSKKHQQLDPVRVIWHKQHENQFFIYADDDMVRTPKRLDVPHWLISYFVKVNAWREDHSIPLVNVVSTFDIFACENKTVTGIASRPSNIMLDNAFGTHDTDTVMRMILEEGKCEKGVHLGEDLKEGVGKQRADGWGTAI
ncbi:hypothetical protein BJ742DRAFT_851651 [Cladochytrium replicatum]|nr:hypothetical protein BJ742DRAFT_851651 [Cladochytrium replicatum]